MRRIFAAFLMLSLLIWTFSGLADTVRMVRVSFYESPGCHDVAADGTKSGYGYDFLQELAVKAGWKVEYVGYDWPWDTVFAKLEKGEIDMVDFVTRRPDREGKMLFSKRPMSYTGCAIRTLPDLAGRFSMAAIDGWGHVRVGVMKGDVTEREFIEFAGECRLDYELREFETEAEGVEALRRGDLELVAFEELVRFPELVVVEICKPFTDHVAVGKDNPALMSEIDAAMAAMDRDDPGWMTRLHQKYFPSPTVYAYVPARTETSGQLDGYLRELLARLDEVLARKIEIRECRADFSDADFTLPSFACGVGFAPGNSERFRFPFQPAGSRRVDLLASPGAAADAREKLKCADGRPVRIGSLKREADDFRRILERYALQNSVAFELLPQEDEERLRRALSGDAVDLVICHSGDLKDLAVVGSCGFVDFYLAPTPDHPELAGTLDKAFKYLRLDDSAYLHDLENRYFGIDSGRGRLVRLAAYVENGLSVRRADGSYEGFVIDFMTEISRRTGWQLEIVPLSFAEAQRALADGSVDVMGAAVRTEERAAVYDYSKFDVGPLYYALMKRRDGRMIENRPDTWQDAKIGYQRGSLSVEDLERFFREYGVRWKGDPFNDLAEGEKLVREGRLDAVYTLANENNRDLVPLVMLPTKLCYFCSNRRKPWIKAEMDEVTERMLRENHRWIFDIYERHLSGSGNVLLLSKDEIDYVEKLRGHRIRVSFLDEIDPVVYRDGRTGEVRGLVRQLFDRLAEDTGLEFEYLTGDRPADLLLRVDGGAEERACCLCDGDWYKQAVCRVRRREPAPEAKGTAAIMRSRSAETEIARKNGIRPVVLETREDCYRAVLEGRVEYMVDDLPVAMKWLDVEKRYEGLFYQRVDPSELSRPLALYSPAATDPRLRSILAKARDSLPQKEADMKLFESVYSGGRPLSAKVKSALLTALIIVLVGAVLLLLTFQHLRVARAANRAKSRFLFNMSHDIRTPMNAIRGFTAIAKKQIESLGGGYAALDGIRDCLDKIDRSGELLLSLINSVLDMSRVESGKAKLEETPGDVRSSFAGIATTMQELAKAKGVSLSFGFGDIVDRYVFADHDRCNRVFVNIISNAIKYSKPNGWVKVRCEQVKESLVTGPESLVNGQGASGLRTKVLGRRTYRYTFEDNGIGMSEDFVEHVFEEFSREHNSTTSGIQGTGLGLALCKSLVELMGGKISCRSKLGEGTTFTVELPFRLRGAEAKAEVEGGDGQRRIESPSPTSPSGLGLFSGRRVLLVEDNELNREVAVFVLGEQGFVVESAEDGSVAVRLVKEKGTGYYDFILMDIQMPIMGGYEATKAIRADGFTRPIIALSANAFAEDRAASLAAGMDAHVAKPIKVNELMAVLSKFAEERK